MKAKTSFFNRYLIGEITTFEFVAAIAVIVLFFVGIPMSIISYAGKKWFSGDGEEAFAQEVVNAEAVGVIGEDESKRGYNEKSFLLEDGSYLKQVYAEDVHYYDVESGGFKEIDNTLKENGDVYTNSDNSFKVSMSKDAASDKLITINEHGVTFSMSLIMGEEAVRTTGVNKTAAASGLKKDLGTSHSSNEKFLWAANIESKNNIKFKNGLEKISLFNSLEKVTAKADYDEVYPGVNLEYSLSGRSLKENIVVSERQNNYDYAFKIATNNATLSLENGDVNVYDPLGNKAFTIPKGYMYDDDGAYSNNVVYELLSQADGYILIVRADKEWINAKGRAFPVTIDPTIQATLSYTYKTYWNSVLTRYEYDKMKVETNTEGIDSKEYGMIRFNDEAFIDITPDQIMNATMTLSVKTYSYQKWSLLSGWSNYSSTSSFKVYNNYYTSDSWSDLSNITNYTNATYKSVSSSSIQNSNWKNSFTVTQYAKLAAGGQNYGIVLTTELTSKTIKRVEYYAVNDGSVSVTKLPILNMQLIASHMQDDSYLTTDDNDAEQSPVNLLAYAGDGSVDINTGELVFIARDLEYEGGQVPLSIARVYGRGTAPGMGTNWRLNLSQTIIPSGNNYIYTAADGRIYTIENLSNSELGLTLTINGNNGYILKDFNKNQLVFDTGGRLIEINTGRFDSGGDAYFKLSILYSGNNISEVTDSLGRKVFLNYTSALLSNITDASGNIIVGYTYSANDLVEKITATGAVCQYEYYSQSILRKAINSDSSFVSYSSSSVPSGSSGFTIAEGKGSEVFTIKTVAVKYYSLNANEFELQNPDDITSNLVTQNNHYDIKEVTIKGNNSDTIYKYYKKNNGTEYVLTSVNEIDPTFTQTYSLKPITATIFTQIGETNIQEAYYITQKYDYESGDDEIIYTNYFSGSFIYDYGDYIKGYVTNSYVPDKGNTQSSFVYAGLTSDFYSKQVALNSQSTNNEYYFTFWGKTLNGYLVIICDINYGDFTETRTYSFSPSLSLFFSMGGMKFPIKDGVAPKSVTIKAQYVANSMNQGSDGGIAQIDCFVISKISDIQRVNELNTHEAVANDNPLIRKQYYIDGNKQITYDTYYYADADSRKLLEIRGADHSLKSKYYYDDYNYIRYEINYLNGSSYTTEYVYNEKGLLISNIQYAKDTNINYVDGTVESGAVFVAENYEYNGIGQLIKYTDINGNETNYVLDEKNRVTAVQYDDGITCFTSYANDYGDISKVKTGDIGNTYLYNTSGQLTEVYHNGFTTTLAYDSNENLSSIKAGNKTLITYSYDGNGNLTKEKYGNAQEVNYEYDVDGKLTEIYFGTTLRYSFQYDGDGFVEKIIDSVNSTTTVYSTTYDNYGGYTYSAIGSTGKASHTEYVNPVGQIEQSSDIIQGTVSRSSSYSYDARGGSTSVINGQGSYLYEYDNFGRMVGGSINGFSQSAILSGGQIFDFVYSYNGASRGSYGYTYNGAGNIIGISEGGVLKISYRYDEYDRLIREDNAYSNETVVYTYDAGGNIRKKDFYSYTLSETIAGLTTREIIYKYEGAWADQLTAYLVYDRVDAETYVGKGSESFTISYDGAGNPTTYRGKALTWTQGRELASYGGITYKYNENGLRTYKSDGSGEWKYFWDGDRLFAEYANGAYIWYYYNETGIQGMEYGGIQYYYMKNAFGDVIGIVDASGNIVAKYVYDAWGVATIYDADGNITASGIGYHNRIRYRGYYYDHESGLYYLQSRYYDPQTGRFISADEAGIIYLSIGLIGGANLYAYCFDNPVMGTDSSGYFWDYVFDIISIAWSAYDFHKNPSAETLGWLLLDIILGIIPYVPSVFGKAAKGLSKIDDLMDIGKGINRMDDLHDTIVIGNGMGNVISKANDIKAIYYHGYKPMSVLIDAGRAADITLGMKVVGRIDNAAWLMDKVVRGYKIVDIGKDGRSIWKFFKSAYGMEKRLLFYWYHGGNVIARSIRLFY